VIAVLVILSSMVALFGLSGTSGQDLREACISDARTVEVAIDAYHANSVTGSWPPAGPVDKTSVLLQGPSPYLRSPPSNRRYSINTDGSGGVLVAVPPAHGGGINFDDAIAGKIPGVKNPCDALKD
jgi:hypothetical protein